MKEVLYSSSESISKDEVISNNWQIISKINFSGKLFLRDKNETRTFKGNLNKVNPDSLIYSKINVKHGCIYYHPHNAIPFAVSSEYPVFTLDSHRIIGEFLVMVIQSKTFKSLLSKKTTGISKARVKTDVFLETEIPIPALSIQKKLIRIYNNRINESDKLQQKANLIEEGIRDYLLNVLGCVTKKEKQKSIYNYLKFVNFSNIFEWGIDIIQKMQDSECFIYPKVKIKDLCQIGSGGTPSRSCPQYYKGSIPWVKTGEVLNDEIFDTEEYITEDGIKNSSAKIYPKGSLIIAMYGQGDTRGRTAKLGVEATTNQACAVLYNINNEIVSTDYLWYFLQGRYRDLRSMASGNNQPNLNAGKIKNYDVVVPPMYVQNEIVNHIKEQKSLAKQLRQNAIQMRENAIIEFENDIFEL